MGRRVRWSGTALGLLLAGSGAMTVAPGSAQEPAVDLAARVVEADGTVSFRIPLRHDVEVCEDGVITDGRGRWGTWRDGRAGACSRDVALIVLDVDRGRVEDLDLEPWLGEGRETVETGLALGPVDGPTASGFLVGLARAGDARRAAEHGMMASTLLDGVEVWPELLSVARDRALDGKVRRSALFWVSQVAAGRIAEELGEVAADESEDQDVRDAAVFALSQRPPDESVPALMELVRTAPHSKTRRSALFWLAQVDDPAVVDFFEEILRGG